MDAERSHFSLAGVPVRVEPAFFVVVLVIGIAVLRTGSVEPGITTLAGWTALFFVSVLVHELGHAVAFRIFGVEPRITLQGLGGLTWGAGELSPLRHIVVSLAGPLSALVLLGLPALLLDRSGLLGGEAGTIVAMAVWINVGWSIVNLAPILPLDGGQVLASLGDLLTGGRGRRSMEVISILLAGALAIWALSAGYLFGALFGAMFVVLNVAAVRKGRDDARAAKIATARALLLQGRVGEAEALASQVLRGRALGSTGARAREVLAWARLLRHDPSQVSAEGGPALRAAAALVSGRVDEGVTTAAWALVNERSGTSKALLVMVAASTGHARQLSNELVQLGDTGVATATAASELLLDMGMPSQAAAIRPVP